VVDFRRWHGGFNSHIDLCDARERLLHVFALPKELRFVAQVPVGIGIRCIERKWGTLAPPVPAISPRSAAALPQIGL